ncbi:MAG: DUF1800 domain-containing protein, partial [Rhodospirillaceae bacterium]|nr:DUF1800 domain-containing protein [Rhodospirillaceae bacterium]
MSLSALAPEPSFERRALNRATFGARAAEEVRVQEVGWPAWVAEQLKPPPGDEPELAQHIATRSMHIRYAVQLPAGKSPGWPAVDERRPLNYLRAELPAIWDMVGKTEISIAPNERARIQQELNAATWMRNAHARFQLREVMADFWANHFNVGRQEDIYAAAALVDYDARVIRPRVFGNFRDLLEAVATAPAMLRYLNNAASGAERPTENYVRELLELHTLGREPYAGVAASAGTDTVIAAGFTVAARYTDQDIAAAARAFSGWTQEHGQDGPGGPLAFTGRFIYNPLQHNDSAGGFMGVDLAPFNTPRAPPMVQGRVVLDILADHPATARFVCAKLARRFFGDAPPPAVLARAVAAWTEHRAAPDQLGRVVAALLLGPEVGAPAAKLRRPYEKLIALFRTTHTIVNAYDGASMALAALGDGLFAWPTPEGRP